MTSQLPPQSSEAEESVLGAILIDGDAITEVSETLKASDFYKPANSKVYAAVLSLYEQRQPIDILTVSEELERRGQIEEIGGRAALADLCDRTPTAVHAKQYAKIVERKAVLRGLISAAGRIASIGYEDPADAIEAIDRAESELFAISERRTVSGFTALETLLGQAYERLDHLHQNRGQLMGLRTGFTDIDSKRSTSCSLLISSEKTPTDFPSRTAAYSAMLSASDVLPTEGRAASTIKSEACSPCVLLSMSVKPVRSPMSCPRF